MRELQPAGPRRSLLMVMTLTTGLLASGYGVMFTVLDDFRDRYHISETRVGLIVAMGFFTSFIAQVLLAPLADRGRARTLLMAGLLLDVVGLVGMACFTTFGLLLLARLVMGLGMGAASPAIRRVVIVADQEHLGRNVGRLLSADVAGFALGPVVSALTVDAFGLPVPFVLIAVAVGVLAVVVLRTSVPEASTDAVPERFAVDLLRQRPIAGAVLIGVAVFLMIGTFDALWVIVMKDLDAPTWMANVGITVFALPLIVLGPIGGRFAQRHGPLRLASVGLVTAALFMAAYGLLPAAWMLLAVGMFHALNDGLTVTGTGVAMGLFAPAERQAAAQGLLGGMQTLVGGLSATAAGWSYQHVGRAATFIGCGSVMVALVGAGSWLAGPAWHSRPDRADLTDRPGTAPRRAEVAL